MKKYTIYEANKSYTVASLEWATTIAIRSSQVGQRVSVFDGSTKIATYQFGKKIS